VIVVDTGPLYAAADTSDAHHAECAELLDGQPRPLVVPVSVVIEASYLIERRLGPLAEERFLSEITSDDYQVEQLTNDDIRRMAELVHKYADLPLGAVDASVVAISERLGTHEVATLDHRHFRVVRPRHVEAFTLLP
jgi:hypothetical protein